MIWTRMFKIIIFLKDHILVEPTHASLSWLQLESYMRDSRGWVKKIMTPPKYFLSNRKNKDNSRNFHWKFCINKGIFLHIFNTRQLKVVIIDSNWIVDGNKNWENNDPPNAINIYQYCHHLFTIAKVYFQFIGPRFGNGSEYCGE